MKSLQIVLMGWEHDRIMYGLKQKPCNKAIFISSDPGKAPDKRWGEATTNIAEKIGQSIKPLMDYEVIFFSYHDMDECLISTVDLFEKACAQYDEVNVNISSGTTVLKMAMMLASQYYPIKLFYVIPAQYTHPGEIITVGARGLVDMPSINLSKIIIPKGKKAQILSLINSEKKSFTNISKAFAKIKNQRVTPDSLKLIKSAIFYHLKQLKEEGLIDFSMQNKQLFVSLTSTGKFIALILSHKSTLKHEQTRIKVSKKNKVVDA